MDRGLVVADVRKSEETLASLTDLLLSMGGEENHHG
jgi:hypothetical protein